MNYTQFKEIGKTAAKWGVKAIQVTGWHIGGQDQAYPDHSIDPRLGTFGQSTLKQLANDEHSSQLTDLVVLRGICSSDQVHASTRTSPHTTALHSLYLYCILCGYVPACALTHLLNRIANDLLPLCRG